MTYDSEIQNARIRAQILILREVLERLPKFESHPNDDPYDPVVAEGGGWETCREIVEEMIVKLQQKQ